MENSNPIEKGMSTNSSKESLLAMIKELQAIITTMSEKQNKEQDPVDKMDGQLIINPKEKEIIDQAKKQVPVKKSIWTGTFWTK